MGQTPGAGSGIHDRPPGDPRSARNLDELAAVLEEVRRLAGPVPYRDLADRVNALRYRRAPRDEPVKEVPKSALQRMMRNTGQSVWKWDVLFDVLEALGVPPERQDHWKEAWATVFGLTDPGSIVEVDTSLPERASDFTDRPVLVHDLISRATPQQVPTGGVVLALVGMAGVGKTQLAIHIGRELVQAGEFTELQLYVDLRGFDLERRQPASTEAVLDRMLRRLGVQGPLPGGRDAKIRSYRNAARGRRLVLVLDNAASPAQVKDLLPSTSTALTIVTSRDPMRGLPGVELVPVNPMNDAEAITLLRRTAGMDSVDDAQSAVLSTIAQRCGNLPQALAVVGWHVRARADWTLEDHISVPEELALRGGMDAALTVSYDDLPEPQQRLLRLMAVSPCDESTQHACAALGDTDPATAGTLLTALTNAHLVLRMSAGRHKLHDLVRDYASRRSLVTDGTSTRTAATTRLLHHYAYNASAAMDLLVPHEKSRRPTLQLPAMVPVELADASAARSWLDDERSNLLTVAAHAGEAGDLDSAGDLAAVLARYLEIGAHYGDAAALHELASRSSDRRRRCVALFNLATINFRRADHAAAREQYVEALDLALELDDTTLQGRLHINLGNVHAILSDYPSALDHYQRGYKIASASDTSAPGDLANVLTNLGNTLERLGRYAEADDHNTKALALYRRLGDEFGESIAEGNLGVVRQRLGDHNRALEHHDRARALCHKIVDPQGEALAQTNIGHTLVCKADLDRAEDAFSAAERVLDGVYDPLGHAYVQHHRTLLHEARGDHHLALVTNAAAMAAYRDAGDRQGVLEALNVRGCLLLQTDHPEDAERHHTEAQELAIELGDRFELQRAHNGLTDVHRSLGDHPEAHEHRIKANAIRAELGLDELTD